MNVSGAPTLTFVQIANGCLRPAPRIRLALDSASPPSLSAITDARGPVEAGGIQIEAGPAGRRWLRWLRGDGLPINVMDCRSNREPRFFEPLLRPKSETLPNSI